MKGQINFQIKYPEGCECATNVYDADIIARILINTMKQMGKHETLIWVNVTSRMNEHWACDYYFRRGKLQVKEYDPNPVSSAPTWWRQLFK